MTEPFQKALIVHTIRWTPRRPWCYASAGGRERQIRSTPGWLYRDHVRINRASLRSSGSR